MVLPKNAFTTSTPLRIVRKAYRESLRPPAQDAWARLRTRLPTDRGNLPAYVIAGVNKSGTTALHAALCAHPAFGSPLRKEVHYLDEFPTRSRQWYAAHFWGPDHLIWGEATPEYLDTPGVAAALAALVPDLRVVVVLREPVGRTVSHFHNAVDHRSEARSLADAVAEEVEQLGAGRWPHTRAELNRAYVARSCYARSLRPWFDAFGREQVLVLVAEESATQLPRTLAFLGAEAPPDLPVVGRLNERTYAAPDPAVVRAIDRVTRPHVQELCELLGWNEAPAAWREAWGLRDGAAAT